MKDNLSPEEKLLKLIREEKKPKKATVVAVAHEAAVLKKAAVELAVETRQAGLPLRNFHSPWFLMGFLVVSLFFSLSAFIYPMLDLSKVRLPEVTKEKGTAGPLASGPEVKPLESYLEGLTQRQIFRAVSVSDVVPVSTAAVTNTLDLFKDMTLIGIISSNPPQAVIEDKKTQKTYYLSVGQAIGDLTVDHIQEGKVILDYLGTKYEMYL